MGKKVTPEQYARAEELRELGTLSQKEIMAETGLNLSQYERHFWAVDIAAGRISGGFWKSPDTLTEKAAMIARAREAGESWGLISVRFGEPESRTRKAWEDSGFSSKGMRIGKGGRWVADDPRFYAGFDRAKLGTELVKGKPIAAQVPAQDEEPKRVALKAVQQAVQPAPVRKPRARKATK